MRVMFLLVVLAIALYVIYQLLPKQDRKAAMRFLTFHGVRVFGIVVLILIIAAAAYYLPVSQLLY